METIYFFSFILFSILGWLIDSVYRSIEDKRWVNAGFFWGPICPIYGFGGTILLFIFTYFSFLSPTGQIIIGTMAVILVEFLGGLYTEKVLHLKLWDYSSSRFHIRGYIDLLHSFYWLILVSLFSLYLYPLLEIIKQVFSFPYYLDLLILFLIIISLLLLALNKRPQVFFQLKGKVTDMSVEKYQRLLFAFKRISARPLSVDKRHSLEIIKEKFERAGMVLRRRK